MGQRLDLANPCYRTYSEYADNKKGPKPLVLGLFRH